jgi:hypothetical protein
VSTLIDVYFASWKKYLPNQKTDLGQELGWNREIDGSKIEKKRRENGKEEVVDRNKMKKRNRSGMERWKDGSVAMIVTVPVSTV